jgi:peptide/nickel transport system substrate-binding protein
LKRFGLIVVALSLALPCALRAELQETPFFAEDVASGKLPGVKERLPSDPQVAEPESIGSPGGELRVLMAGPKDTRMMVVYGYARLVGYTPALSLVPDILKSVDVQEGRIFTLHLRRGHKWSDGHPFTAEDFRYWFEDVAQNNQLSPSGLPVSMLVQGEPPRFEVLDDTTVRFTWTRPNPLFLPDLAGADPLYIYCPAHYLKQFHQKYADKATLDALVKKQSQHNWAALHNRMDTMYRNDNPSLPSLEPWILKTRPPADRFIFERNPYYYRVDEAGHQLPYIDTVVMSIADSKIIPAKTGAGESDLQARYLRFDNYTFLKQSEERNKYKVRLWRTGPGSQLSLYPNLNVNDEIWRALVRDLRFRRALSLAVNRHEINQAIYFGLAIEGQNTVLPQSPLYEPQYRSAWATFDVREANRLLDLIGLTKRDSDGTRLLPDGRPMEIIVENSGESTEQSDVLELIRDSWRRIGIRLFAKPLQLTLFRRRVFSGETLMSIDKGIENGLATPAMSPWELAPTSQQQLEWPKWGQYYETKGKAGEAPDLPSAVRLKELYENWLGAATQPDQSRIRPALVSSASTSVSAATQPDQSQIWHTMLQIWADEVYSIGTVAGVLQPIVVSEKLHNVPDEGIYNWDPGAFFGIYKPDGFWFDTSETRAKSASSESASPGHP